MINQGIVRDTTIEVIYTYNIHYICFTDTIFRKYVDELENKIRVFYFGNLPIPFTQSTLRACPKLNMPVIFCGRLGTDKLTNLSKKIVAYKI